MYARINSVELNYNDRPIERVTASLQWTTIRPYFLDAENRFEYPGHGFANLRGSVDLAGGFALTARLNNVADTDIATGKDANLGRRQQGIAVAYQRLQF